MLLPRRVYIYSLIWTLAISLLAINVAPAGALAIPSNFIRFASSINLKHPGIIVIDPKTNQTLFSLDPDIERAPASVLKLLSMSTVLNALSQDLVFKTSINETATRGTFVLMGSSDPWITESAFEEQKYGRAFSPSLINAVLNLHPELKSITLEYNNMYLLDIAALKRYFAGRLTIDAVKVNSTANATNEIASIQSPPLSKIIDFTLLYSDNVLADRLARLAAHTMGFTTDSPGLQSAFTKTLTDLGISPSGLHIYDGNGLSPKTRVTARQVAELLLVINSDPKFKIIEAGLPTSGRTGTLKDRFVHDAPGAVGLVHAKTGWINTTVSLAGFVTVGSTRYVFVIIANHIHNSEAARQAARVTIDQMIATIANAGG